jgi:hypothetical protein
MSTECQLAHQLTSQRCALKGCNERLNALTVQHGDEFCSVECANPITTEGNNQLNRPQIGIAADPKAAPIIRGDAILRLHP